MRFQRASWPSVFPLSSTRDALNECVNDDSPDLEAQRDLEARHRSQVRARSPVTQRSSESGADADVDAVNDLASCGDGADRFLSELLVIEAANPAGQADFVFALVHPQKPQFSDVAVG